MTNEFIDNIQPDGTFSFCRVELGNNNVEISCWRRAYVPGDDTADLPEAIQAQALALWAPEIVQVYQASVANSEGG